MVIKKRAIMPKVKLRKRVVPKKPLTSEQYLAALDRMGELLAAGHGDEAMARRYMEMLHRDKYARLQSIVAKAQQERSWKFMEGCYMQAAELYVLASIIYERYPQHVFMEDIAFDKLSVFLLRHFKKLSPEFRNWYAITAIDLKAGTGHKVVVQPPIRWMVLIITGEWIESDTSKDAAGSLRGDSKRRIKQRPKHLRKTP